MTWIPALVGVVVRRLVDSHVDVITMVLDADWVDDARSAIGD